MTFEAITEAAKFIVDRTQRASHDVALVLGSGLGDYATSLPQPVEIPYEDLPGFRRPDVEGHSGMLVSGDLGSGNALALAGRLHLHEGWELAEIVFAVRTAIATGCRIVVLTNAAGGLGADFSPGDLVLISDHLNLTGRDPLMGPNDERLGQRFVDLTDVYSPQLRELAKETARDVEVDVMEGVYAWLTGPSYETPAEIRMLSGLGADLVGMSTVPEAIAARHMGAEVIGISVVTNLAAGISPTPLSHSEVQEVAEQAMDRFARFLDALLPRLIRT